MSKKVIVTRVNKDLAPLGFTRKGSAWNRRQGSLVEVLDLQSGKFGDDVTMNVGVLEPGAYSLCWEKEPDPFVQEWHCTVRERIGFLLDEKLDRWWKVDDPNAAAEIITHMKERALPFLTRMHSLEEMCKWLEEYRAVWASWYAPDRIYYAALQHRLGRKAQACAILASQLAVEPKEGWYDRLKKAYDKLGCPPE